MLDIITEYRKGIFFIRLAGRLNYHTSFKINYELSPLIKAGGIKYVVYNVEELRLIDKNGINALDASSRNIVNNKGKVIICGLGKYPEHRKIKDSSILSYSYSISSELWAFKIINL